MLLAAGGNTVYSGFENLAGYNLIIDSSAITSNVTVTCTGNLKVVNRTGNSRLKAADGERYEYWVKYKGNLTSASAASISGTITARCNGCVKDYAGNVYDLEMAISGITAKPKRASGTKQPVFLCWNAGAGGVMRLCAYTNSNTTSWDSPREYFGASYTVTYRVLSPGTNSIPAFGNNTSVFMGFEDLDTKGMSDNYSGGLSDYCEGVQILSGLLSGEIYNGYKGKDTIQINDNARTIFTGTQATDKSNGGWRWSSVAYRADAKNGWSVKWAGFHAGTAVSLTMEGLDTYRYATDISYQQADGTWTDFALYDASGYYYSGIYSAYSCT